MAPEQKKKPTGGNTPKPQGGAGAAGQSAKDRSRAQSRPVSAKGPGGKGGKAGGRGPGGTGGRGPGRGGPPAGGKGGRPGGVSGTLLAWGAVGLVLVVIVVLVIVKVTSGSTNTTYTPVTAAPASVVQDVTSIPASVYDKVGVTAPAAAHLTAPFTVANQPPLSLGGKTPAMFYYGAEYCPYCAAERWAMTAALSRFGTWSGLDVTASSHTDVYPATPTFSYRDATFTSQYLTFVSVEQYTNVPSGNGYTTLQNPTKEEQAVIDKYSSPTYIPGATAGQVGFPFIDIGNVALISGASYNPGILTGATHADIASNLSDPTNLITQAIVGTANYISAAICASTHQQPAAVCQSSGVQAAAKALKLS